MSSLRLLTALTAFTVLVLSATGFSAAKNYAVVVGVDQVPGVATKLKGAVHDAQAFAEQLRGRGIEPILLTNDQATRAAVEAAIARGAGAEHLVVYFAGLGSGPNTPRILTAEGDKGFPLEDLDKDLLKARAGSTTVILDTSFAGLRAEKDGPSLYQSRFYRPANARSLDTLGANAAELPGLSHKKICYITASRYNEDAFEDTIDGKAQGVFTHFLCERLAGSGDIAWQTVQWDVASQVAVHLEDAQHPNFPVSYLANAALAGDKVAVPEYGAANPVNSSGEKTPPVQQSAQHRTLWTLFNVDNVDPTIVTLSMNPNKAEVEMEKPLEFEVTVGKAGYLVVVEHSVEGTLMPIFPRNGDITTAQVRAGQHIVVPNAGEIAYADRPGKERLKALLFDDIDAARELLKGLEAPSGVGATFGNVSKQLESRGIRFARDVKTYGGQPAVADIPTTADLTFRVVSP